MNNPCNKMQDKIADYILKVLAPGDVEALHDHFDKCPGCREYAQNLQDENRRLVQLSRSLDEDMAQREDSVIKVLNNSAAAKQIKPISIWRTIMKTKITKLTAAAVIIIAVFLGLEFIGAPGITSVAYGITDVPELLRSAKTLHIESTLWIYENDPNQSEFVKATTIPMEKWLDIQNMRERFTSYEAWSKPNSEERGLDKVEGFRDREYAMDIRHNDKTVRFNKCSLVKRKLQMRRIVDYYLNKISQKQLDLFVNVGQETIGDTIFDIWEGEDDGMNGKKSQKIRCWLSPATGELGRIYYWEKSNTSHGNWLPTYFIEKIELDITIPESIFEFNAPQDYTYRNTKETAFEGEGLGSGWYFMGDARVSLAINFTLDDGSVIVAWHSDDLQDNRYQEQEHLFKNVAPGEKLPKLPMVIYGLEKKSLKSLSQPGINYVGRHLTFTKKKDWYYEWALYVPERHFQPINEISLYRMLCRFNLVNNQEPKVGNPIPENKIEENEFDTFVLGAMAELSDDGKSPEGITYDGVLELAQQIRESLDE